MPAVAAHPASEVPGAARPPVRGRPTLNGRPVAVDLDLDLLEAEARRTIGEMAYAYYAGGADDEYLLAGNVEAWRRWSLHPKVLVDVSRIDTSTTVLGQRLGLPILAAPTAIQGLAHPARRGGLRSGHPADGGRSTCCRRWPPCDLADVAAAADGLAVAVSDPVRWMQVYVLRDRGRTAEMVARSAAAGFGALVLTVDAPVSGLRRRELRGGVHLPEDLALPNLAGGSTQRAREGGFMAVVSGEFDPALTYDDIGWLAGLSDLPVVVKGVARGDDAVRAVETGARGIVVSNHGARQLDDAPATADVLAEVVEAVAEERAEVYVDGCDGLPGHGQGLGARRSGGAGWPPGAQGPRPPGAKRGWPTSSVGSGPSCVGRWLLCGAPDLGALEPSMVRARPQAGDHLDRRAGARAAPTTPTPRWWSPGGDVGADRGRRGAAWAALARSLAPTGPPHIGVLLPNVPDYLFWLCEGRPVGFGHRGTQPDPSGRGPGCSTCGPPTAG